jgi:hypothetical protein
MVAMQKGVMGDRQRPNIQGRREGRQHTHHGLAGGTDAAESRSAGVERLILDADSLAPLHAQDPTQHATQVRPWPASHLQHA